MKNIFLDSDIILDALLKRPGFVLPAMNVISLGDSYNFRLITSSVAFVNVNYFLDRYDKANRPQLIRGLRSVINIAKVDEAIIDLALSSSFQDFEDAVQYFSAKSAGADVMITRNIKDYTKAAIPVLTAEEFLRTL